MIDLKLLAGARWRISLDESAEQDTSGVERLWLYRLEGRRGHVYVHSSNELGAWTNNRGMRDRLAALPGSRLHQCRDREWSFILPVKHLDEAAGIVKARRRRRSATKEERARLIATQAPRFRGRNAV